MPYLCKVQQGQNRSPENFARATESNTDEEWLFQGATIMLITWDIGKLLGLWLV